MILKSLRVSIVVQNEEAVQKYHSYVSGYTLTLKRYL